MALFLQAGYYQCMAIEANRYIGRVEGTSKSLIILRPGSEIHVLSVPFFN